MVRNTARVGLAEGPLATAPALLTRMAIGPRASSAAAISRSTAGASVTSAMPYPRGAPAATAFAQRRFAAADDRHRGARGGERRCDGAADAASAAGDESMPACERHRYSGGTGMRRPAKIVYA